MPWTYLAVIILVAAATIIFALQDLNAHLPLELFVGVVLPPGRGDGRQRIRAVAADGCGPKARGRRLMPIAIAMSILPGVCRADRSG